MVAIDVRPEKLGAFRVRGKIGEGGMASVYVGLGANGALVALKVIKAEFTQNKDFRTMFLDEGKIASRLDHPNIVKILSLDSEAERLYMVMDLVRGQSLHALWDAAKKHGERLAPAVVSYIGASIAAGLHHAHEAKDETGRALEIVHRDVNPSNVIVSYDGDVKMIDFGLAKAVNRMSQTAAGVVKGKISYLSPEQVTGKPLDRRADIFSLGTTLWELSTDRRLFKAESKIDTVQRIFAADVPDPLSFDPTYPVLLWSILRRCLKKDRGDRYATAADVEAALREFLRTAHPGLLPREELRDQMSRLFAEELRKQDAWLESATHDHRALHTLRPHRAGQPALESLPLVIPAKNTDETASAAPITRAAQPPSTGAVAPAKSSHAMPAKSAAIANHGSSRSKLLWISIAAIAVCGLIAALLLARR